ncbi:MAG TPA: NAD(P)H-hydrate dehydratase [Clostridiaceae bacterium]|nr:NAD(P)H-hydrate dehydratase [Clostridiaceae bacterium]
MLIVTPAQMSAIDKTTIEEVGIPGIVLMENAAIKVVNEIQKDFGPVEEKQFLVVAGKGNNGGDALAVARHLFNMGGKVTVFLCASAGEIKGDAKTNLKILEGMDIHVAEANNEEGYLRLYESLKTTSLVVDGIFGTGFRGEVAGWAKEIIKAINNSGKPVVSIDIPSGVSGETGAVGGVCINARKTVTFGMIKLGLAIYPGRQHAGEMVVADIGFPKKVIESFNIKTRLITGGYVAGKLPKRLPNTNKGDYGKVFLVTGSKGMTGAGCLAAKAALRTGSGLVYLGVPESLAHVYGANVQEAVSVPLREKEQGYPGRDSEAEIDKYLGQADVVAAGPGLSTKGDVPQIVSHIISTCTKPLVLDADALNAISMDISVLEKLKAGAVLTPHPGEMSRLTGLSIKEIELDRINVAREFSAKWNVHLVLKGAATVVAWPDGSIFINSSGNPGMATGGSGDVLAGMIASLIGQGLSVGDAAVAGVYLHGLAGDIGAKIKGQHGLIAGDIVEHIPNAMLEIVRCPK